MKLKLPPRHPWYRDGDAVVTPDHNGFGIFELPTERLPRFGPIVRDNPWIEVLSEEPHWFRAPEGTERISVQEKNFNADEFGYFQAPVGLAPAILHLSGFSWIGSERPPDPIGGATTIGAETRALRRLLTLFKDDPKMRLPKSDFRKRLQEEQNLGPRAFDRVWRKATDQFPDRRRAGRRGKSNHDAG